MEYYIASLDVGTTTLRCSVINNYGKVISKSVRTVKLLYPKPGYVEIEPDELWKDTVAVIKKSITDAKLYPKDIRCIGISTQRATFINWRKDNGHPLHNFITWKDLRAYELVKSLNSNYVLKVFRSLAYILYLVTRNNRYLTGSRLKLACNHVTGRLLWALSNIPQLKSAFFENNVRFGTLETWLLYKLTGGRTYVTDISNASATGFYDPFVLDWGSWAIRLLKIPLNILPPVIDNDYDFGATDLDIFGVSIPIRCVMSDQSSSMYGLGCLQKGDLKVTLGTGGFLNLNTEHTICTSTNGMFPLAGWRVNGKLSYLAEVPCNDVGSLIQWALHSGFIENPSDTHELVQKVKDPDGVFFIPAFSGLGTPIFDEKAASGFVGIKPTTRKEHLVRAILESIVFRISLSFFMLEEEIPDHYHKIRVDGGVSKNDFVCQMLADVTNLHVERLNSVEMSSLGVAFIAGLKSGIWKNIDQVEELRKIDRIFVPTEDIEYKEQLKERVHQWIRAAEKLKGWYCDS